MPQGKKRAGAGLEDAARLLEQCRALVIAAGAGMGVDSGLPDFRGPGGFWGAYPPYRRLGLDFYAVADPRHFARDPAFAWGFYGHRLALYRRTRPHRGFLILQEIVRALSLDCFVVTSNVDGHFQKAGFSPSQVLEVHGSIHYLQCAGPCGSGVWENQSQVPVDESTMRAREWPRCPSCARVARPNILMFGDGAWIGSRSDRQARGWHEFLTGAQDVPLAVLELGAGTAVPTIRHLGESLARERDARIIRVNPGEPDIAAPHLGLAQRALPALEGLAEHLLPRRAW